MAAVFAKLEAEGWSIRPEVRFCGRGSRAWPLPLHQGRGCLDRPQAKEELLEQASTLGDVRKLLLDTDLKKVRGFGSRQHAAGSRRQKRPQSAQSPLSAAR